MPTVCRRWCVAAGEQIPAPADKAMNQRRHTSVRKAKGEATKSKKLPAFKAPEVKHAGDNGEEQTARSQHFAHRSSECAASGLPVFPMHLKPMEIHVSSGGITRFDREVVSVVPSSLAAGNFSIYRK